MELDKKLNPKIICTFDKGLYECWHETNLFSFSDQEPTKTIIFRLKIESKSPSGLKNCSARLLKVSGPTSVPWPDALPLTIAPAERENPTIVDIYPDIPAMVDLLLIKENNEILIASERFSCPASLNLRNLFSGFGNYTLTVGIAGDEMPTLVKKFSFTWSGIWRNAELHQLD